MMHNLTVPAQKVQIDLVQDFVRKEMEAHGFNKRQQGQMALCVEEIFVNIASYAYPNNDGSAVISTDYDAKKDALEVSFKDKGLEYNPLLHKDPDIHAPAEERGQGGLGILLVKKIMDAVAYTYKDQQNIFTIKMLKK
jgi:serine/threonine-protein kinase RsbW